MAISATSKTKFYIGTSAANAETDTYSEVKRIEDLGEFGDNAEVITFLSIEDGRVHKLKGAKDAGDMEITCGFDAADAGQNAMRAALDVDTPYNFKVVLNDDPVNPTEHYFKGLVTAASNTLGGANDVAKCKFTVAITSELTTVLAA
jgi:hypothetical protein